MNTIKIPGWVVRLSNVLLFIFCVTLLPIFIGAFIQYLANAFPQLSFLLISKLMPRSVGINKYEWIKLYVIGGMVGWLVAILYIGLRALINYIVNGENKK